MKRAWDNVIKSLSLVSLDFSVSTKIHSCPISPPYQLIARLGKEADGRERWLDHVRCDGYVQKFSCNPQFVMIFSVMSSSLIMLCHAASHAQCRPPAGKRGLAALLY